MKFDTCMSPVDYYVSLVMMYTYEGVYVCICIHRLRFPPTSLHASLPLLALRKTAVLSFTIFCFHLLMNLAEFTPTNPKKQLKYWLVAESLFCRGVAIRFICEASWILSHSSLICECYNGIIIHAYVAQHTMYDIEHYICIIKYHKYNFRRVIWDNVDDGRPCFVYACDYIYTILDKVNAEQRLVCNFELESFDITDEMTSVTTLSHTHTHSNSLQPPNFVVRRLEINFSAFKIIHKTPQCTKKYVANLCISWLLFHEWWMVIRTWANYSTFMRTIESGFLSDELRASHIHCHCFAALLMIIRIECFCQSTFDKCVNTDETEVCFGISIWYVVRFLITYFLLITIITAINCGSCEGATGRKRTKMDICKSNHKTQILFRSDTGPFSWHVSFLSSEHKRIIHYIYARRGRQGNNNNQQKTYTHTLNSSIKYYIEFESMGYWRPSLALMLPLQSSYIYINSSLFVGSNLPSLRFAIGPAADIILHTRFNYCLLILIQAHAYSTWASVSELELYVGASIRSVSAMLYLLSSMYVCCWYREHAMPVLLVFVCAANIFLYPHIPHNPPPTLGKHTQRAPLLPLFLHSVFFFLFFLSYFLARSNIQQSWQQCAHYSSSGNFLCTAEKCIEHEINNMWTDVNVCRNTHVAWRRRPRSHTCDISVDWHSGLTGLINRIRRRPTKWWQPKSTSGCLLLYGPDSKACS